jgi:hypothetical protein
VDAAKTAGVPIGLGSDWSPTGSKNLLGELKVAWLYSQAMLNGQFSARNLVAMATRDAAKILKWDKAGGMIEAGKRADLIVIDSTEADPYDALLRARETDIQLVSDQRHCPLWGSGINGSRPRTNLCVLAGQRRKLYLSRKLLIRMSPRYRLEMLQRPSVKVLLTSLS